MLSCASLWTAVFFSELPMHFARFTRSTQAVPGEREGAGALRQVARTRPGYCAPRLTAVVVTANGCLLLALGRDTMRGT